VQLHEFGGYAVDSVTGNKMSSDPLARSDIWTEVPSDTEYEAVYAAVTTTERGRWFLTEYASRNRHADTVLLMAAIARVEAAIRGEAPAAPALALDRNLTAIAAAIRRIETLIVADRIDASDISAAAERILDIAFGFRESAADAALCDALDAAAREICTAGANSTAAAEQMRSAAGLLRDLAGRVDTMIKSSSASPGGSEIESEVERPGGTAVAGRPETQIESNFFIKAAEPPIPRVMPDVGAQINLHTPFAAIAAVPASTHRDEDLTQGASEEDLLLRPGPLDEDFHDSGEFTDAAAAAATSQNASLDVIDAASLPGSEPGNSAIPPMEYVAATAQRTPEPTEPTRRWFIESPDFAFQSTNRDVNDDAAGSSGDSEQQQHLLVSELPMPRPQDDPADLFESSISADTPPFAAAGRLDPLASTPMEPPAEVPPPSQNSTDAYPAPSDPLLRIRALSEQEMIALFG
jgi:hypothetical protein